MRDSEAPAATPFSVWRNASASWAWPAFFSSGLAEQQMRKLRLEQEQILVETRKLVDNWCTRRQETAQSAWLLMDELQRNGGGPAAIVACMRWYNGALQQSADDATDQFTFGCKVAKCCGTGMIEGLAACPASSVAEPAKA
jgi:hypothetical protein